MKKEFVMVFDIPVEMKSLARRIERRLNRVGAQQIQQSVWRFDKLQYLLT